jgi:hypothetical protein
MCGENNKISLDYLVVAFLAENYGIAALGCMTKKGKGGGMWCV